MRVRFICLRTLIDAETGRTAEIAWGGLSSGCHQHAYELSPMWTEVQHLVDLVEQVAQRSADAASAAAARRQSASRRHAGRSTNSSGQ